MQRGICTHRKPYMPGGIVKSMNKRAAFRNSNKSTSSNSW